jgi:AAA domain-containing protein
MSTRTRLRARARMRGTGSNLRARKRPGEIGTKKPDSVKSLTAAQLAEMLGAEQVKNAEQWQVRCPAHNDRRPSLSITERDGRCLLYCHAKCSYEDILSALRRTYGVVPSRPSNGADARGSKKQRPALFLPFHAWQPKRLKRFKAASKSRYTQLHEYMDESGRHVLFIHCRNDNTDPKQFTPAYYDGVSVIHTWPAITPLYHLDEISARPADPLLVVEGEKTADAAQLLLDTKYVVTTWAGGAKRPDRTDWRPVRNRVVTIWPDNDAAGFEAADQVRNLCLSNGARAVRIVQVPATFPESWDLADPLPANARPRTIRRLLREAASSEEVYAPIDAVDLLAKKLPPRREIVPGLIPEGLTVLGGMPKSGKSFFALRLGVSVVTGGQFLGAAVEKGSVLYIALEDNERRCQERLVSMTKDDALLRGLKIMNGLPPLHQDGLKRLDELLGSIKPRLVVIDTLKYITKPAERHVNLYDADLAEMRKVREIAIRHQTSIVAIHHTRKAPSAHWLDEISGSRAITGTADTILVLRSNGKLGELHITGRDVPQTDLELAFDIQTATWNLREDSSAKKRTPLYDGIIQALREDSDGLSPKNIALKLEVKRDTIRTALKRMLESELVTKTSEGKYHPVD